MLNWVKASLSNKMYEKVDITDFTTSFKNGLAFCALIHQFNPKCIKFEKLNAFETEANIRLLIYATNVLLNFDNLLSFNDFINASERAIILLIAECFP